MRYTQGGFMEDSGSWHVQEASWLSILVGCVVLIVSGVIVVFMVMGYIYVMRTIVAAVTNIFP